MCIVLLVHTRLALLRDDEPDCYRLFADVLFILLCACYLCVTGVWIPSKSDTVSSGSTQKLLSFPLLLFADFLRIPKLG